MYRLSIKIIVIIVLLVAPVYAGETNNITSKAINKNLNAVYNVVKTDTSGKVADYIPALGKVDPNLFGIVVVTVDGDVYQVGDTKVPFAIESLSKVFTLALALEDVGLELILEKVGAYQTGLPFNSIIASDIRNIKLQNPLVNAGAIITTSYIKGENSAEKWKRALGKMSAFAGRELTVDKEVCDSEIATNSHNVALAWNAKSMDFLIGDPVDAVARYTSACSVALTCKDLGVMGASLANGGINPITHQRVIGEVFIADILAFMMISGLYDSTGPWILEVGLPGKSGVGGGILAIVPGRFAIAVFSPPLDESGNSVRGVTVAKKLSQMWDLHLLK